MCHRFRIDSPNEDDAVCKREVQFKKEKIRVDAPLVWLRLSSGVKIQDLKEPYYEDVLQMFKDYYVQEEVLCRNSDMQNDEISKHSFLNQLLFNIKDNTSIIAVHEYEKQKNKDNVDEENETPVEKYREENERKHDIDTHSVNGDEKKTRKKKMKRKWGPDEPEDFEEIAKQDLIGCCVMRVVNKSNFGRVFSRVEIIQGKAHKKCVALKSHINKKVDLYNKFNCNVFLRYYAICIKPNYRRQGLGLHFLRCGIDVARAMKIPVVMGVFSNFKLQKLGKLIGMQVMHEINYDHWFDSEGELIFEDPGPGNYTCNLMAGLVPPPPPPKPPPLQTVESKGKQKGKK